MELNVKGKKRKNEEKTKRRDIEAKKKEKISHILYV